MKGALLIIDGLGDLPIPELDGRTPLEAAHTPVLNRFASHGLYGLVDPVQPGTVPNTHSGSGMLFGVLPEEMQRIRRGPVEAAGAGRNLKAGDVALRANLATLEANGEGFRIRDRRAGRITQDTAELASVLDHVDLGDGVTATLQPTDQHRCVLVFDGPGLSESVSDTDPGDHGGDHLLEARALDADGEKTAVMINRFVRESYQRLKDHPVNQRRVNQGLLPANAVITRGAGEVFELGNAIHREGIAAAVVAGCNTVLGLARILGFEAVSDSRFTAAGDTDLNAKMAAVLQALDNHQLVYLHIKAPDLFGHDRQPESKRVFLERLDGALQILADAGIVIALTADHTTDSNSGAHTADPVPSLLYGPGVVVADSVDINFGEEACRTGNMPRQHSSEFLSRLFSMLNS